AKWVKCAFSEMNLTSSPASSGATPAKRTRSTGNFSQLSRTQTENTLISKSDDVVDLTSLQTDEEPPPAISENWMEGFAPGSSEELAVHPKKVGEVRSWLLHCEAVRKKFPAQICLLTGPTGAGKTATLRVLAKEMGYQVQEWINPVDCEVVTVLGDQPNGSGYVGSHLEAFKSFLLRASRYKSLLVSQEKRLLLVEDFPNIFLGEGEASFEELLDDYSSYGKSPLIFIVADSKSRGLNMSFRLFPEQLKAKHRIEHISFNPIASTIMQKSIKSFCSVMRKPNNRNIYKVPAQTVLESIVVGAQGDIRNALINLHLSSLVGVPSMPTKQLDVSVAATTKGRKAKTQSTLKSIGRDESITLMHAMGRVMNPKSKFRKECILYRSLPLTLSATDSKRLQHSPEDITESFRTEPRNFVNFVHANYLSHFKDVEGVVDAIHDLGLADCMLNEYRDDNLSVMALNLAIRGVMLANREPVSGWIPVRGPKKILVKADASLAEQKLLGVGYAGISKSLYATEYKSMVKLIAEKMKD
ncbi:hypothetical protein KR074_003562, partial [Drosophila pseudoananassae]